MTTNQKIEVGCVFDGVLGVYTTQRVCRFASDLGWDGHVPTDDEIQSDGESALELEDSATEWLNEHIAEEGFTFGWHEGSYFYWSHDEWNQLV